MDSSSSSSDEGDTCPGFSFGEHRKETKELQRLTRHGGDADHGVVKELLRLKANPCWNPSYDSDNGMSAVWSAMEYGNVDLLRLYHAHWPDIDPPYVSEYEGRYRILQYVLEELGDLEMARCLMELGLPFRHLQQRFRERAVPSLGDESDRDLSVAEATAWKTLYTSFCEREDSCRRAAVTLMSKPFRTLGMPRDIARIVARYIWHSRTNEAWQSQHTRDLWHEQFNTFKRACRRVDGEF